MAKFTVTLQPSGHQFEVEDGEAVLAAALRQGFVLPYGCKNGACGSCKAKILSGSVDYGVYQKKALPDADKAQGKALFCQAKPLSDLVLEARTIGAAKDIPIKTLPCRVQRIERPTHDVAILFLKLPASERLQFLAGQYIDFLLRDGSHRSFSMANPPHADECLELHLRNYGGPFSIHAFTRMKEKDILRFEGPLGTFFLREDSAKPVILLASGTGFAPLKAIVEHALRAGFERPRLDQAIDRGGGDGDGRNQDERTLEAAREVFGLGVAIGMLFVRRSRGDDEHGERHGRAGEVDRRLERVREQADGIGKPPRQRFQRDRRESGGDREQGEMLCAGHASRSQSGDGTAGVKASE